MTDKLAMVLAAALMLCGNAAAAFDTVHFASLDEQHTVLDAYLFRSDSGGPRPAVVFLHGCGGVIMQNGQLNSREVDWAERLNAAGFVALVVDSLTPRHFGETCSVQGARPGLTRETRPKDAYAALAWLQAQDFVRGDRIGVMGWSQGGGTILHAIGNNSTSRPAGLPRQRDFHAAVAFYPAPGCSETSESASWTTTVPTLVLIGAEDVWIQNAACQAFLAAAAARGASVQLQVYPGAYHDFDWPGLLVHRRPEYTTATGVVPIVGMDPAARDDALQRVPGFFAQHLGP
jgi:dienelactone hydrolase